MDGCEFLGGKFAVIKLFLTRFLYNEKETESFLDNCDRVSFVNTFLFLYDCQHRIKKTSLTVISCHSSVTFQSYWLNKAKEITDQTASHHALSQSLKKST